MNSIPFCGRSHPVLGRRLAADLELEERRCLIDDFANGEIRIEMQEDVSGRNTFIMQSTAGSGGRHLVELLLLVDTSRRRGARELTTVILYLSYAKVLNLPLAYVEKIRKSKKEVSVQSVSGEVKNRSPVIVDDRITTGGTMVAAIEALLEEGAKAEISILANHCLLGEKAVSRLESIPIRKIIARKSVPGHGGGALSLERYNLAQLLADTLRNFGRS